VVVTEAFTSLAASVRVALNGATSSVYSDAVVIDGIRDAFRRLNDARHETRYSGMSINDVEWSTATSATFDDRFRTGIIYFAAARVYEGSLRDAVHQQLAAQFKQMAEQNFAG